ncbi:XRE family transcriptional regulator [Pseudoxanthomonas winnipegensis]|uniref:helix-turn-helix domain-containing protein n=1 Tax=Pseudoxanthomonas winnipegensis TaxID=2480810 RepID=UPI00102DB986|nr:helix-turn-helix transcriptional regulator [Pseudoxanthomonas winnipegensis]RZZ89656.1 XRE family transcriptional regulator [Pseudoxanthomonas winnipegensis]
MATDSKSVQKAFGEALRQMRVSRGISQQELALESELDRTYISLLERGLRQPTITTLMGLSDALDIDPALLIKKTKARLDGNQN